MPILAYLFLCSHTSIKNYFAAQPLIIFPFLIIIRRSGGGDAKIGELENGENEHDGFYASAEGSSSGVYTICKYGTQHVLW